MFSFCENPNFREKREEVKDFHNDIWLSYKTFLSAQKYQQHKYKDVVLRERWNVEIIDYKFFHKYKKPVWENWNII